MLIQANVLSGIAGCRAAAEFFGGPVPFGQQDSKSQKGVLSSYGSSPGSSMCASPPIAVMGEPRQAQRACVGSPPSSEGMSGFFVTASAYCPPRTGSRPRTASRNAASRFCLASVSLRTRKRRRGRGSGSGSDDEDRADWDAFWDSWDGTGGSDGGGGGDGWSNSNRWNNGDFFHRASYEAMWLWQALCVFSMCHSVYHLLFPQPAGQDAEDCAAAALPPSVAVGC